MVGCTSPAPAPGIADTEPARLRGDRTLKAWYLQAKRHFLPPTSSFQPLLADHRGWKQTGPGLIYQHYSRDATTTWPIRPGMHNHQFPENFVLRKSIESGNPEK